MLRNGNYINELNSSCTLKLMSSGRKQSYQRKGPIIETTDSSRLTDLDLIGIKPGLRTQQ